MPEHSPESEPAPVALITGAAARIGASIARHLHQRGYRVIIHYHHSAQAAEALSSELNTQRPDSSSTSSADLSDIDEVEALAHRAIERWGQLDALVNNASSFYPTPLPHADQKQWQDLLGSNLKGPFFLCQATSKELMARRGAIVNISDIHAAQPLHKHSIYSIAKAGNVMLTKTMAQELAPHVRVNGIAPGAILWPENNPSENAEQIQAKILKAIPLQRMGSPEDIALLAAFLITNAHYMTGQTIAVDGGKHLANI